MADNAAPDEAIIEKIRKLLALAETSEGDAEHRINEAKVAMGKATALLQQHNLDMADIGKRSETLGDMGMDYHMFPPKGRRGYRTRGTENWVQQVASALSAANFCKALYGKHHVTFIGRTRNVEVVKYMFASIAAQLEDLGKVSAEAYGDALIKSYGTAREAYSYGAEHILVFRKGWMRGAAIRVAERLYAELDKLRSNGQALMIVNDNEIKDFMKEQYGDKKLGTVKAGAKGSLLGQRAGYNDGDKITFASGAIKGGK